MEEVFAPRWDGRAPWVETWYALVRPADAAWALWVRYQLLARPGHPPRASVWGIAFADRAVAGRADAHGAAALGGERLFATADGWLARDAAQGAVAGLSWDLAWSGPQPATSVLPFAWMRRASFPRMKVATPVPSARVRGSWRIGDRAVSADGATLTLGHTWGTAHALRWAWVQAPLPEGAFEAVAAVPFRGSPTLTAARLQWRGRDHRLAGARTLLAADSRWRPVSWSLTAAGGGAAVRMLARGRADDAVVLEYRDPSGGARYCHAADRATADLRIRMGDEDFALRVPASLEVGLPQPDPSLAGLVRPYDA